MLIKNELYKIFKKKKIYVSIVVILITLLVHAIVIKQLAVSDIVDWITLIKTQFAATGFIIFLTVILFSADIFSEDYLLGTVKMLFVRPQKRVLIFISKLATSFIILISLSLIVLVISFLINTFLFNVPLLGQYISDGQSYISYIIKIFLASIVEIGIYIFIASMLAIIFKHSSVVIIICLVARFASSPILSILTSFENIKKIVPYVLFYNTDLSKYINDSSKIWFSIVVLLVYVALFVFISYKMYCKRDVY